MDRKDRKKFLPGTADVTVSPDQAALHAFKIGLGCGARSWARYSARVERARPPRSARHTIDAGFTAPYGRTTNEGEASILEKPNRDPKRKSTGSRAVLKFVTHSKRVWRAAKKIGWLPGARYTNLRDVRTCEALGFVDIDLKSYNFERHMSAVRSERPSVTVARDVESRSELAGILKEAERLSQFCRAVIVVPKDPSLARDLNQVIPKKFLLGYSVPTRYGRTPIPASCFRRPTHLLGGRPDVQRKIAEHIPVVSFDCNRFTLDAAFGDYFDGEIFRPHPRGGYERCLHASLKNITQLWDSYRPSAEASEWLLNFGDS